MFEKIKEVFSQFTILHLSDLYQIASIGRFGIVKKDEHLLKIGDLNHDVFIVVKGLLRHYVIDENGVEKTLVFIPEKSQSGSFDGIFLDQLATENIVALENSIILKINTKLLDKIAVDNIRILTVYNYVLKQVIIATVTQLKFLQLLTPEERYKHFCITYPHLEQRVKQKDLASYLGITPTSLSRLRARLVKN